ncbi:putative vacuolar sorting protein SNF7 family protein [Aspergillus foveolatus]|uniref:putative vacuolar sorting protein SNF7 family protein n=1 Tax=Aspergillus foveolatus TaxID=210207 RepID=UPI003CCD43D2
MSDLLNYILSQDSFRKNRLPSLYSDFSIQKKTNPDGYQVNVAAWEQALTRAARNGYISSQTFSQHTGDGKVQRRKANHLTLHVSEGLLRDLEIPELGRPVALGAVFEDAVWNRTMVPVHLYKASAASLRQPQWGLIDTTALSPWNVMAWGLKQIRGVVVGSGSDAPRLQTQELVLVSNLQEAAEKLVKQVLGASPSRTDLVFSKESFVEAFGTILNENSELSDTDYDVLMLYLSRDKGAIAYDGKTIRFRPTDDSPREITEQDTAISLIKSLTTTMMRQVGNLEKKIAELDATARAALSNKNRVSALAALRSKKLAEHNLQQRLDTLAQLEQTQLKIEQTTDHVEYLKVMKSSTDALRGLNAQLGDVSKVEDVVYELREEMSKVDEIGNIMGEAGPQIDETEIDEELEELEFKEREAKEEQEAERTRKQLAELDNLGLETKGAIRKAPVGQNIDSALEDSIEKLSQMSVEEGA